MCFAALRRITWNVGPINLLMLKIYFQNHSTGPQRPPNALWSLVLEMKFFSEDLANGFWMSPFCVTLNSFKVDGSWGQPGVVPIKICAVPKLWKRLIYDLHAQVCLLFYIHHYIIILARLVLKTEYSGMTRSIPWLHRQAISSHGIDCEW